MTCNQIQPVLNALVDGELPFWQARRVRRHLDHCAACAAEREAIARLTAEARAWRRLPADPIRPTPRRIGRPAFALAVTIVGGIVLFVPGQIGHPTPTLADVAQTMGRAKMVSCLTTQELYDGKGRLLDRKVSRSWTRRSPAAMATVPLPERCVPPNQTQEKTLTDDRGTLGYWIPAPQSRMSRPYQIDLSISHNTPDSVLEQLFSNHWTGFASLPDAPGERATPTTTENTTLQGKPAVAFRRVFTLTQAGRVMGRKILRIFVEPQTLHLLQIQLEADSPADPRGWHTRVISTDFRYDETPPAGVFDWSPPSGVPVVVTRRVRSGKVITREEKMRSDLFDSHARPRPVRIR